MLSTMDLSSIDWPNVTATLIAAAIGGKVAMSIARAQMNEIRAIEQDRIRRELGRELIEAVDSYVHIPYRGAADETLERQRLRRRILSLTALLVPEQFNPVEDHLNRVDKWWRGRETGLSVRGVGYTATEEFMSRFKQTLFAEVFKTHIRVSETPPAS